MRKFTILTLMLSFSIFASAQQMIKQLQEKAIKKDVGIQAPSAPSTRSVQAVGDTLYYNDFSDPSSWVIGNFSGDAQDFVITTEGPTGAYSAPMGPIASTTAANGFALFDGDLLGCSGCAQQDAYIETKDPVNLTGYDYISLVFQQYYRAYTNEFCWIEVSTDHVNWTQFLFNTGMQVGAVTANPKFMYYNISSAAGNQPQVWIRLHIVADWGYAWMIDDIAVVQGAANDIVLEEINPWFTAPNSIAGAYLQGYLAKVPYTQIAPLEYTKAAIFNNGPLTQNNPSLNIKINDYNSDVFETDSDTSFVTGSPVGALITATRDSLYSSVPFLAPSELKNYKMTYTVTQDEVDANPATNVDTASFSVTDVVFSHNNRFNSRIGPDMYTGFANGDFIGAKFTFINDQEVNSISYFIHPETTIGASFFAELYAYDFASQTWAPLLANSNAYTITADDLGKWITVPLEKNGSDEFIVAETMVGAGMSVQVVDEANDMLRVRADNSAKHYFPGESLLRMGADYFYVSYSPGINLNLVPQGSIPGTVYVVNSSTPSCVGGSDGTLTVTGAGGGGAPYTYLWSNDSTTASITGLSAGSYTVTVTDASFNDVIGTFTITDPVLLEATDTPDWNSIDLHIIGGTPPYTYVWTGPNSFSAGTQDIDNLAPGAYTVTVTDSKGCIDTLTEVITNIVKADSKNINIYPNPSNGIINISNAENSKITVFNILGETVVSAKNNKSIAKIDVSNLAEGTYIVKIVSNNNTTTKRIYIIK